MTPGRRWPANLATLANGLVGVGAILYTLAGNKPWAVLLIVSGVAFDGLDGHLARRSGLGPSRFGRVADSVSDAITFGLAPAALLWVHTDDPPAWAPYLLEAHLVALAVAGLAVARLVYFTLRGYQRSDFVGVPTPTNALAVSLVVLFLDAPAFLGTRPELALSLDLLLALTMVLPLPFPKIRRGHPLRAAMAATSIALVVAVLPLQFHLARTSLPVLVGEAAAAVAAIGLASYYLVGPFTVPRSAAPAAPKDDARER